MRNEPDTSRPMQERFAGFRKQAGRPEVPVPNVSDRTALDDGIFRDPQKREAVIDYIGASRNWSRTGSWNSAPS